MYNTFFNPKTLRSSWAEVREFPPSKKLILTYSRFCVLSPAAAEGGWGGRPRPRPAQARRRGEGLGHRHPPQDAQGLETLSAFWSGARPQTDIKIGPPPPHMSRHVKSEALGSVSSNVTRKQATMRNVGFTGLRQTANYWQQWWLLSWDQKCVWPQIGNLREHLMHLISFIDNC